MISHFLVGSVVDPTTTIRGLVMVIVEYIVVVVLLVRSFFVAAEGPVVFGGQVFGTYIPCGATWRFGGGNCDSIQPETGQ